MSVSHETSGHVFLTKYNTATYPANLHLYLTKKKNSLFHYLYLFRTILM